MGGILVLVVAFGIIYGARKFCGLIGAPLWFAKFLFICGSLVATYFLFTVTSDHDFSKSWGGWVLMLVAAATIILVGFGLFKYTEEEDKRKARSSRSE